jgi:hypothetical protein
VGRAWLESHLSHDAAIMDTHEARDPELKVSTEDTTVRFYALPP